jgi:hypothetical protein
MLVALAQFSTVVISINTLPSIPCQLWWPWLRITRPWKMESTQFSCVVMCSPAEMCTYGMHFGSILPLISPILIAIWLCKEVLSSLKKEYHVTEEGMHHNSMWIDFPYSNFSYSTFNLPESPSSCKFSCNAKKTWFLLLLPCSYSVEITFRGHLIKMLFTKLLMLVVVVQVNILALESLRHRIENPRPLWTI